MSFSSLTFDDSGMYQCVAENRHGVIYANAELRVFGESKTDSATFKGQLLRWLITVCLNDEILNVSKSIIHSMDVFFLWPWLCQLDNPHRLSLACAPTFERNPLKKVLAPRNGRVVIKCRPKGAPKPTFTWSKDTELLSNSTRWEETFSNAAPQLTVICSQRSKVRFVLTYSFNNHSAKQKTHLL